ncbi:hypothetical protein D9613_005340 [Agrocybe pediades]|uniref:ER membrane protein complex subunit 10 n=1 Tax=Agrocybe pediades TaxID=84607 RepID=A0A8H4QYF7_9AGAR|nr:hypothetical protein D9613_005340 [Agrocybe pediades]
MRLFAAALYFTAASAADVLLYHRIFHPDLEAQPYLQRATVSLSTSTLVPSSSLAKDLASFAETLQTLESNKVEALYQVAVAREGDTSEAFWDYSSVKACYLGRATADTILLHLPSGEDEQPFSIDYFVSPIPRDGSCPISKSTKKPLTPSNSLKIHAGKVEHLNSTVLLRRPSTPPLPELRAPPPLTPEGEVVKPVPEKTFLQKYWMYIGAFVLVLLVSSGPEEPEKGPRRAGGE